MKNILVTGGAGYIGSHICVELLSQGYGVVVMDNLCNSSKTALTRAEELSGKKIVFYESDIRDREAFEKIFAQNDIEGVIHMAGLKAVGESVQNPLQYFDNNISGTIVLLEAMKRHGVKQLIFSSSATVYDLTSQVCLTESSRTGESSSPYGRTKLMIEQMLADLYASDSDWSIVRLRYFNPIGAHKSGRIGENPLGVPDNLMPYITQVAAGKRKQLHVFGNDYDTPDGTCIRDYIHVVDLADGHSKAMCKWGQSGLFTYNLGTGQPQSVLQVIDAFEQANHLKIDFAYAPRRAGDAPKYYADASKAKEELGWCTHYNIYDMCKDSWNWQKNNPNGYE
ncbi:MAG: UDP-glucose 4-epimerase GalE [Christensenellaceae bacterium]